jgi:6-pyruvoyltetrahydropterin/6-carboxytetrahydropterin synthase
VRVCRQFRFEAAHLLPDYPGPCRDLHGHSYRLVVSIEGPIDPASGLVIDFSELKHIVEQEVIVHFDHTNLNDFLHNPTAENLAVWIWDKISIKLPGLVEIELHETEKCSVIYRGS